MYASLLTCVWNPFNGHYDTIEHGFMRYLDAALPVGCQPAIARGNGWGWV